MSFTDGLGLLLGNGAEEESFERVPEILSVSGLGSTNAEYDTTNWDSDAKEYIAGLSEGNEMTIEMNRLLDSQEQNMLIADVENRAKRNFRLTMDDLVQTETFAFTLTLKSWSVSPNKEDKHTLSITGKISGKIIRSIRQNNIG
ncbi:phage tail tube protein [Pleionea sediminis]|uniref:phage tail tube protein n=1 Tax=Pleionea sediminis TaxID=2569479 RepID=UPI001185BD2D|nr:phage tail tube protein [Pleionea sediminis]